MFQLTDCISFCYEIPNPSLFSIELRLSISYLLMICCYFLRMKFNGSYLFCKMLTTSKWTLSPLRSSNIWFSFRWWISKQRHINEKRFSNQRLWKDSMRKVFTTWTSKHWVQFKSHGFADADEPLRLQFEKYSVYEFKDFLRCQ